MTISLPWYEMRQGFVANFKFFILPGPVYLKPVTKYSGNFRPGRSLVCPGSSTLGMRIQVVRSLRHSIFFSLIVEPINSKYSRIFEKETLSTD